MPVNDFRPLTPEGQVRAAELRRLGEEVRAQDKVTGSGPVGVRRDGAGFQLSVDFPLVFWAKITGNNGFTPAAHAWTQQLEKTDGTFADDPEGRTGSITIFPAFALDGGVTANGHIVRLYLGQGGEFFLFDPGMAGATGSSLEVREVDGSPDVPNVTLLFVDQATGLAIESTGVNSVTLQNLDAAAGQKGVVNLAQQVLGADDKRFGGRVFLGYGGLSEIIFSTSGFAADAASPFVAGASGSIQIAIGAAVPAGIIISRDFSGGTNCSATLGHGLATAGNVFFEVDDAGGSFPGITGTGLTSVDVRGGIVYGSAGGAMSSFAANDPSAVTFAGGF